MDDHTPDEAPVEKKTIKAKAKTMKLTVLQVKSNVLVLQHEDGWIIHLPYDGDFDDVAEVTISYSSLTEEGQPNNPKLA